MQDNHNFYNKVDYHFDMLNVKNHVIKWLSKNITNNFFHCQFPFDTNKTSNINHINSYGNIIVNSDFTLKYYKLYNNEQLTNHKIHILYPNCINNIIWKNK